MNQQKKAKLSQFQLQKQQRLMAALRVNLRKRKVQVKARQQDTNAATDESALAAIEAPQERG